MTQKEWEKVGSKWKTTSSKVSTVYPALKKVMGNIKGKKILDVGCGDGYGVIWCREKGADCIGVDLSSDMIEACKKRDPEGKYSVEDAKNLKIKEKFDYVISIMVFLSFDKKEEITKAVKSMASKLDKNGKLIIVCPHPAFDHINENMDALVSKSEGEYSYSKKGLPIIYKHKTEGYTLRDFHWMIEDYVGCIKEAGLVIEDILEPLPLLESEKENPKLYRARVNFPQYIFFVCK